ncbi:MAG: Ig-like domain-containing protein [Clostridia bacterium]|nr:Ig-like domain-containing protein [Clostridia bacterium]
MKSKWIMRGLALLAALAMSLPAALAEELGELDLYDPSIYVEGAQPAEAPAGEAAQVADRDEAMTPQATELPEAAELAEGPEADVVQEMAEPEETSVPEETPAPEETPVPEETPAPETVLEPAEAPAETVEPVETATAAPTLEPLLADADAEVAAPVADLTMGLGETYPLDGAALLNGVAATGYASDKPEIAAVDASNGIITAKALGMARITVTGSGATATYTVAVLSAPGALAFPGATLELGKGERRPFAASAPANTGAARITYASSKPKVLEVDASGNLTAKKTGTVVLTATAYNGATATSTVKILKAPSKLKLPAKTAVLSMGESRALTVTLPKKSASALTWASDNPGVVSVDAAGNMRGVAAGTATVTVRAFNNKKASCKVQVLNGAAPAAVSLNATALTLGKKEKFQLVPAVGAGEAAVYAYASSKRKIAAVSATGLITAKKPGTAVITVATQNGKTASVTVTVSKAPKKISLSAASLTIAAGQTGQLSAALPAGTASAILWESSDASIATVDAGGRVTALRGGVAYIRARTFNRKSALCKVVVSDVAGAEISLPESGASAATSAAQMAANLKKSGGLGSKRDAIAGIVQLLVSNGFEPAFAAGVGANIYAEGTYGLFESSKYVSNYQKRPKYFCYLDGGNYYTLKGGEYVVSAVYLSQEELEAYTGEAEKKLRFGEANFYLNSYSGKYAQNVDLNQLEALMTTLAAGGWQGKFGLGIVQWTGARTRTLVSFYRKHAGEGGKISAAQVVAAENEMILYDLKGSYAGVYTSWKSANGANRATEDAARSAGSLVCLRYEVPANKESKAVTRGNKAAEIYKIMMGN